MSERVAEDRSDVLEKSSIAGKRKCRRIVKNKIRDQIFFKGTWLVAGMTLTVLLIILGFILIKGIPYISWSFISKEPENMGRDGGILSIIVSTLLATVTSVVIAAPTGVLAAVYFTEYAKPGKIVNVIRFFTEVLAGIPSIIFGLFGFAMFVIYLGMNWSILSGSLTLSIMILPTIIRSTEESLKAVPIAYREGSLSLGASKWYTIRKVVIPSCKAGIITGVILGIGRAIGETAAVMLTLGGSADMPTGLMDPARTMALHLYMLASEGLSDEKTYATAALLVMLILVINMTANAIGKRGQNR